MRYTDGTTVYQPRMEGSLVPEHLPSTGYKRMTLFPKLLKESHAVAILDVWLNELVRSIDFFPGGIPRNSAKPFGLMKRRTPDPRFSSLTADNGWMTTLRCRRATSWRIVSGRPTVARSLQIWRAELSRISRVIASRSSNFSPTFAWIHSQNCPTSMLVFQRGR